MDTVGAVVDTNEGQSIGVRKAAPRSPRAENSLTTEAACVRLLQLLLLAGAVSTKASGATLDVLEQRLGPNGHYD